MSLSVQNADGETGCAAAGTGTWTGADELPTEFWLKYFAIVKVKTVWQDVLTYLSEEEFWAWSSFITNRFFSVEVVELYALKTH